MADRDDDFLSRWSRRKQDARGGLQKKQDEPVHKPGRMRTDPLPSKEEAATAGAEDNAKLVQEASLKEEKPVAPVKEPRDIEDDAPVDEAAYENFDFESLNYASDYKQFMKKGVPEAVRRRALRMLWSSNPILANIDGLNDYDEDFTDAAMVLKTFASNYKVGSGYMTEEERLASYSEEARTVGSDAVDEDGDDLDVEDFDVEDMDDEDDESDGASSSDMAEAAGEDGDEKPDPDATA